jgi:hypothetical protein
MFIVEFPAEENYLEAARGFIGELENYKRSDEYYVGKPAYFGDFQDKYYKGYEACRYNVNDCGDIYFIHCSSINDAMKEIKKYWREERSESQGYKRKDLTQSISDHHDFYFVEDFVEKYFTLI